MENEEKEGQEKFSEGRIMKIDLRTVIKLEFYTCEVEEGLP